MDYDKGKRTMWILYIWIAQKFTLCQGQSGVVGVDYKTHQYHSSRTFAEISAESLTFLTEFDREASEMCNRVANAEWRYTTNSSDYNKRRMREEKSVAAKFACISWRRAGDINSSILSDVNIRRQFNRILKQGHCGLDEAKFLELNHLLSLMKETYNNAKICPYAGNITYHLLQSNSRSENSEKILANYVQPAATYCDLKLDPDIDRIMQTSRSESQLRYIWIAWREKTGPPNRNNFMRYLDLANQAARYHGFSDAGDQMRSLYEDADLYFNVQDLWSRVQPLYRKLFTFVRKGLVRHYGRHIIREDGPIPAHLLGNMWAQTWKNIFDLVLPDGRRETPDITGEMIRQGYTPLRIFQAAEEFFTSIGLPPMLPEFWRNSLLQKPTKTYTECTPSAWDFCNNIDFRIKQCTQVTLEDYINSHHEMTHIQYYMQYSGKPFVYRSGPNPAFHEAASHVISLCVGGPAHLQKIGLLPNSPEITSGNSRVNIEYLLGMALDKLPFMAFSLTLEKWRWYVFEKGPIGMNARWWELRLRYQGLIPPVARNSPENFDSGSKYHVISDQDYIKYFIATLLQFQIFAEMCSAANHVGPLHTCDFYRSRDAGRILTDFMEKGASVSPSELIKIITRGRTSKLSVDPLLDFFRPLEAWLDVQNRDAIVIGWNSNLNDVALYQSLQSSGSQRVRIGIMCSIIFFILSRFCSN